MASPKDSAAISHDDALKTSSKPRKQLISPTSSFVDFAELQTEIYTEEMKSIHDYDPHTERNIKKPTTNFETCVHLLKGSIGAGLLAMPKAFSNAGVIPGVILTIILGLLCIYAMDTLLRMQYIQCKRFQVPFLTLPRSMKIAFLNGPWPLNKLAFLAPFLVDFFLVSLQIGICTAYVIFISDSMKHIFEPRVIQELDLRFYMLITFVPLLLINFIRNLKLLMPVSLIANFLVVIALSLCFYIMFTIGPFKTEEVNLVSSVTSWPLFIGTVLFALEAVGVIIALEHNMKNPQDFLGTKGIFPWSLFVVVTLYTVMGLIGYLKYGKDVKETIIASLPKDEWLSLVVEGVYAVCIYGTYPLQCYVSLEIIWGNYLRHHIKNPNKELMAEYILRTVVVVITLLLAVAIPRIDIVISLIGALCLASLGLIFPFLLELCTMWPDSLGRYHYVLIKDLLFMLLGVCILVLGTYVSLYEFIVN